MNSQPRKALGPFKQLITMNALPLKGALSDAQLEIISDAGVILNEDRVERVGKFSEIKSECKQDNIPIDFIDKPVVGLPAFVDAHTHICFGGSRARDYAMRVGGKTYLEIAKEGGGIWDTVQKTRAESLEELENGVKMRLELLKKQGIGTVEVKSGYGLTINEELKMLQAIHNANQSSELDLIATCLPAHIVPKDYSGDAMDYVQWMLKEFFPIVKKEQLSNRADIFIEESAFGEKESRQYLSALQKMGFVLTIHADQFSVGGSKLGVEYGALSVDHLEASGDPEVEMLAKSEVIPVALPGASLGLGEPFTPARKLLDAGASLAIASDWNPGSAPMGNLLTQASILGAYEKLSIAETIAGMTVRAAAALGLKDRGKLNSGYLADIVAFPTNDYREIFYHQGQMQPMHLWKKGQLIL